MPGTGRFLVRFSFVTIVYRFIHVHPCATRAANNSVGEHRGTVESAHGRRTIASDLKQSSFLTFLAFYPHLVHFDVRIDCDFVVLYVTNVGVEQLAELKKRRKAPIVVRVAELVRDHTAVVFLAGEVIVELY